MTFDQRLKSWEDTKPSVRDLLPWYEKANYIEVESLLNVLVNEVCFRHQEITIPNNYDLRS